MPLTFDWIIELRRLVRFGFVGVLATLVYIGAAFGAIKLLHLSPVVASIVGLAAATLISYFGHTYFSFKVEANRIFFGRFLMIVALSFVVSTGGTWLLTDVLKLPDLMTIVFISVLIPAINYLCNRFWVFLPGLKPTPEAARHGTRKPGGP